MGDEFDPECKNCGEVMEFLHEEDQCGSSSQWYWCKKCGTALVDWDDRYHWKEVEGHQFSIGEWKTPAYLSERKEKAML